MCSRPARRHGTTARLTPASTKIWRVLAAECVQSADRLPPRIAGGSRLHSDLQICPDPLRCTRTRSAASPGLRPWPKPCFPCCTTWFAVIGVRRLSSSFCRIPLHPKGLSTTAAAPHGLSHCTCRTLWPGLTSRATPWIRHAPGEVKEWAGGLSCPSEHPEIVGQFPAARRADISAFQVPRPKHFPRVPPDIEWPAAAKALFDWLTGLANGPCQAVTLRFCVTPNGCVAGLPSWVCPGTHIKRGARRQCPGTQVC